MDNKKVSKQFKKWILFGAGSVAAYYGINFASRKLVNSLFTKNLQILMGDSYDENMWELVSATRRVGPQNIIETNLRSSKGRKIERPLGTPKNFPSLEDLMFSIGQFHVMPTELDVPVDTKVIIGKQARKPVIISMPILITGMAFGVALSEAMKVALAKGASKVGTATNTGEGPFLASERKAAKLLTLQYNRGDWNKTDDILEQADMIEIQFGQGAIGGVGHVFPAKKMDHKLRELFRFPPGKDAIAYSRQPEVQKPQDLPRLINKLRRITGGAPIGVKIGAGKFLEKDLAIIVKADPDFIVVEGAEAATKGSAPILQDDFGIPTIYAIDRAANFLSKNNLKDKITLIACGKLRNPGDFLKAIALGADACYIGAIALFAVSHDQVLYPLPYEPPTQLAWYDGKFKHKFNVEKGANTLANFLRSCNDELIEGVRALGKKSIHEVSKDDLASLNETVAKALDIPMVYEGSE